MLAPTRAGTIAAQAGTCLPDATGTFDVQIEKRRLNLFRHDGLLLNPDYRREKPTCCAMRGLSTVVTERFTPRV